MEISGELQRLLQKRDAFAAQGRVEDAERISALISSYGHVDEEGDQL